jgi:hypothetical protein
MRLAPVGWLANRRWQGSRGPRLFAARIAFSRYAGRQYCARLDCRSIATTVTAHPHQHRRFSSKQAATKVANRDARVSIFLAVVNQWSSTFVARRACLEIRPCSFIALENTTVGTLRRFQNTEGRQSCQAVDGLARRQKNMPRVCPPGTPFASKRWSATTNKPRSAQTTLWRAPSAAVVASLTA